MTSGEPFISIRAVVEEIRQELRHFREEFHQHMLEEKEFKSEVVTKTELDVMNNLRKTTRRYIITSAITVISVVVAAVGVLLTWG